MTESLRQKDIDKATEHKRILEERQRTEERHRAETETPWRTRYFEREVSKTQQQRVYRLGATLTEEVHQSPELGYGAVW